MKSNKPFWFAFNTADWLSSKSVRMMSLAERGAYIGLLATSWGEDQPGTLPAAEDTVRRLCEMSPADWAVSGPALLAMFPLSECGTYRYNPRLLDEAAKREQLSEKKAEAGRRSAAKREAEANRKATDLQQKSNTCSTPVENPVTGVGEKGNQLQSQLQLHSSKEEVQSKQGAQGKASQVENPKAQSTKQAAKFTPEDAPVFRSTEFYAHLNAIGYDYVDKALYLLRIVRGANEQIENRRRNAEATNDEWKIYIERWLDNDKLKRKLLLPDAEVQQTTYRNSNNPAPTVTRATSAPLGAAAAADPARWS
ncbi:YdaU family protein [Hymenobacter aerilatus]|uniref:YdaU family protein n=1 Tax=Hymenobacter aerilatus TaxID=2932251 RepID=A0A8T9T3M6_9BACT|nr:DUF1376 domain-containing protein [Hymenobacter aerilatus]UOR07200.1 YdaU family protein [Hymenobacter aerilatus]